jgi:hypothetical protein
MTLPVYVNPVHVADLEAPLVSTGWRQQGNVGVKRYPRSRSNEITQGGLVNAGIDAWQEHAAPA